MHPTRRALVMGLAAATLAPSGLRAQGTVPDTGPLKILVPFTAGALTDIIARLYAERLATVLGQPIVVENHPGAGGTTATRLLASSPPDGRTWLFVSSGHATNPALRIKLPYDTVRDFSGLALVASSPSVVVVNGKDPAQDLAAFVDNAKRNPGKTSFGSAGLGSATHLAGEYFAAQEHIKLLHVPFKGVQEAVNAVVGGQIDAAFPPIALAQSLIKSGNLRALAVTSPDRVSVLPDVPTVAERGIPSFDSSIWYAMVLPSGTPKPLMEKYAGAVREVGSQPDVVENLKSQGLIPKQVMLGDFDKYIVSEMAKAAVLVKASGYQPQ